MGSLNKHRVDASAEYCRIRDLPRRTPEITDALTRELTQLLRTPLGAMSLRPVQALALHDIGVVGGLLGPIRVGGGKTLVSLLAPHVLGARRPLLLLPAALVQKTERERRQLMQHWLIPRHLRIQSYEAMGRVNAAQFLQLYNPDLIICDEAHRLKNPRAACTRRVARYMKDHPECRMVAMSGTLIKHSLRDFGTLAAWSLKNGAPVPLEWGELEMWSDAIDENTNAITRVQPGVLGADTTSAREWFRQRLLDTPGVVSTPGDQVACSLYIRALEYKVNTATEANFTRLRGEWCTPDGWMLSQATDVWRHARELAIGLHYLWDPRPPEEWLNARREWAVFVRETIKDSVRARQPLDSELQVANAVDRGDIDDAGALAAWRAAKPIFEINSVPQWHDDGALIACEEWARHNHGIIWCSHNFFGRELARRTGLSYYGAGGVDQSGSPIESESGKRSIIASIAANSTGRNLQMFSRNLITAPMPGADWWEQLLGRTHRDGQQADEVTVDVLLGCAEHYEAFVRASADARMHQETMGQPQKLLMADIEWPSEKVNGGCRWSKTTI